MLSLAALLGGIGLLFAAFGRWNFLGWHGREQQTLSFRTPGDVALTPGQRACACFLCGDVRVVSDTDADGRCLGTLPAELSNFFGIDWPSGPIQLDAHLAYSTRDFLGGDVLCWRREYSSRR